MTPYALRLRSPWKTATGSTRVRRGFLVRAESSDGTVGWGDAAPLPGATEKELRGLSSALRAWTTSRVPLDRRPAAARFAWGQAMLCAEAAAQGIPLWKALAKNFPLPTFKPASRVWVNATLPVASTARTVERAVERYRQGYRCLKLKASSPAATLEALGAVRSTLGSRVALRVDVNGAWTRQMAGAWLGRLAAHDVEYVEQPLPAGRWEAWRDLRRRTGVTLAADEELAGPDAERFLLQGHCDVAVLKPMALGGFGIRLARIAQAKGMAIIVTDSVESAVGRMGTLHLAAVVGHPRRAHGLGSGDWLVKDVVPRPPRVVRGALEVPTSPGLGLTVHPPGAAAR